MGAEVGVEVDEAALLESADEMGHREQRRLHRSRIARVGADVTASEIVGGEEGRAAAEVENEVAGRARAVPRLAEQQGLTRGWGGDGVVVDAQGEGAEMTRGVDDRPLQDWEVVGAGGRHVLRPAQQHGDVEMVGEPATGLDRDLVMTVDQDDALALHGQDRGRGR